MLKTDICISILSNQTFAHELKDSLIIRKYEKISRNKGHAKVSKSTVLKQV